MAHAPHGHGADNAPVSRGLRRLLAGVMAVVVVATVAGLVVLWPRGDRPRVTQQLGLAQVFADATVDARTLGPCTVSAPAGSGLRCFTTTVTVDEGPARGTRQTIETVDQPFTEGSTVLSPEPGDAVVVGYSAAGPPGLQYYLVDYQRRVPLAVLFAIFAVVVLIVGRLRGLGALAGLGVSLGVIVVFVLPAVLRGESPLGVALTGSATILLTVLYLAYGVSARTTTAVLGTLASLLLIAGLSLAAVEVAHLSGLATEEAQYLRVSAGQVDLRGLILAGFVIGALGVLDDVTVTQVSAVWELHGANPSLGRARLYAAAMRIGRDHIASTTNTLVLAYAGASLPLLILFVEGGRGVGDVINSEVVAVEIMRTLVGSIGLVAAVPITTALAVLVVPTAPATTPEPAAEAALPRDFRW